MSEAISAGTDATLWLSRQQSRRIDQLAIQRGISGEELMERAGAGCAKSILEETKPRIVWIACGSGNNGGDGFVIARKLRELGVVVRLWLVGNRERMSAETAANFNRWIGLGGTVESWPPKIPPGAKPDVAVDCLLGTGSSGDPRGDVAKAIDWLNQLDCLRVAIDLPSGLDCDSGQPGQPTVRADQTLTMVGPKHGFREPASQTYVGQWKVVDLGVPAELIQEAIS